MMNRLATIRRRARQVVLVAIAFLPFAVKRVLYRWLFGYRIARSASVGIAYLDCAALEVAEGARIGHGVGFVGCGRVRVGRDVVVGPLNLFRGGAEIELREACKLLRFNIVNSIPEHDCVNETDARFILGEGAVVTAEHRIDFTDRVRIGRGSILGGRNSSIWTHNVRQGAPVEIGDHCYIGSEVRFAPGAAVPDYCIVGLGAVVVHRLKEPWTLYAGVPARPRRALEWEDFAATFGWQEGEDGVLGNRADGAVSEQATTDCGASSPSAPII